MRHFLRITSWCLVAAFSAILASAAYFYYYYDHPSAQTQAKTIVIPRGTPLPQTVRTLHEQGVVDNSFAFLAVAGLFSRHHLLKAGEYAFDPHMTPRAILDKMAKGDTILHKLTIPEGLSVKQIEAIMAKTEGLTGDFPPDIREGTLMPNTYYFSLDESRHELVTQMQKAMQAYLAADWQKRDLSVPIQTPQDALILASIVEKETGVPEERGHIASVFINRLTKGMKLQTDPTVIYALTDGKYDLGRCLTHNDLLISHPYNTYVIDGLPPSPISNPSKAAIDAVLNPPQTNDLFFVANGNGSHRFAATMDAHMHNINLLRETQQQKQTDAIKARYEEKQELAKEAEPKKPEITAPASATESPAASPQP